MATYGMTSMKGGLRRPHFRKVQSKVTAVILAVLLASVIGGTAVAVATPGTDEATHAPPAVVSTSHMLHQRVQRDAVSPWHPHRVMHHTSNVAHHVSKPTSLPKLTCDNTTPSMCKGYQSAAGYANGAYAWSQSDASKHHYFKWIDVTGDNSKANVLDVEPGDATNAQAHDWVQKAHRLHRGERVWVYTYSSNAEGLKKAVSGTPNVGFWIAAPSQFAGNWKFQDGSHADATQYNNPSAQTDISVTRPAFYSPS